MLSVRQQKMLIHLLEKGDYVKLADFQHQFDISMRTVRHDLLFLEDWLQQQHITLERNRKLGVFIHVDEKERYSLVAQLQKRPNFVDAKERTKLMLKQLLEGSKVASEQFLSEFQISKNTFLLDVQSVREWLVAHKLELIREQGLMYIQGKESDVRRAYLELLRENFTEDKILQLILGRSESNLIGMSNGDWFKLEEIDTLNDVVLQLEKELQIEFSDSSYSALILHLLMAVERLRANHLIKMDQDLLDELKASSEFRLIQKIISSQLTDFEIIIPEEEIGYITQHVLGAQRGQDESQEDKMYVDMAEKIVTKVEERLNLPIMDRGKVIEGLAIHLKPAFYRYKYNLQCENPLLDQMEIMYGSLLTVIEEIVQSLFEPLSLYFNRHELSYIALHVCSGLDQRVLPYKTKVAIVCSSGLGTSAILQRKMTALYPQVTVVKKYSYKELFNTKVIEAELLISTIDIQFPLSIPVINVSPLLTSADQRKLLSFIGEPQKVEQEEGKLLQLVNEVLQIMEKHSTIHQQHELMTDLFSYFQGQAKSEMNKHLSDFLPVHSIHLQERETDWIKVIEMSNALLMKSGCTNKAYEVSLIEMANQSNHHFIITEGVAFPHAAPENGVFETGFSLITLKEPIRFGARKEKVWLILTMAATDQHQHLKALATILEALNDQEFMELLRYGSDPKEIWQQLRKKEAQSQ
ncbi:hypothetical protein BKP45_10110 [Anaerobacillus alkalidiazotrophicus]|uniref:PTS system EIIA component n=1 Tax=Anaerobacillus alkalidiazotrophicus TaxID=472963 RepID=A0A1S2M5S4_9BACI|nr:BglG family transcription antiterminator [Anaerobacillus alkalidiazotrophicus]OIJ20132.1 hypothetical protein BKP45_10110 [Anaerobacillus alkalidiazotrophicus]